MHKTTKGPNSLAGSGLFALVIASKIN